MTKKNKAIYRDYVYEPGCEFEYPHQPGCEVEYGYKPGCIRYSFCEENVPKEERRIHLEEAKSFVASAVQKFIVLDEEDALLFAWENGLPELLEVESAKELISNLIKRQGIRKRGDRPQDKKAVLETERKVWERVNYWHGATGYQIYSSTSKKVNCCELVANENVVVNNKVLNDKDEPEPLQAESIYKIFNRIKKRKIPADKLTALACQLQGQIDSRDK